MAELPSLSTLSPQVLATLYVVAITAEAMTAALVAGRRGMDWVGVCVIACVTALGGGSLRDVLLGHYPLTWVQHPEYLWTTAIAALVTACTASIMRHLRKVFLVLDAVGLVVFTVIGCQVALAMGLPITIVLVSGMITGCAGGVLRDVLCNQVPLIFRKELYASVSAVTGAIFVSLLALSLNIHLAVLIALVCGFVMRMVALRLGWNMPTFLYRDKP